jgi:hypothetical protein
VVDKEDPANYISFCGTGVKKIGPTQFEMIKTDFVPTKNLSILILSKRGDPVEEPPTIPSGTGFGPPVGGGFTPTPDDPLPRMP